MEVGGGDRASGWRVKSIRKQGRRRPRLMMNWMMKLAGSEGLKRLPRSLEEPRCGPSKVDWSLEPGVE
jgi:hypothetical protein